MPRKYVSRFTYINEMPEDSKPITSYKGHGIKNLYYSPEKKEFYRKYSNGKSRRCELTKSSGITVRTDDGRSIRLAYKQFVNSYKEPEQVQEVSAAYDEQRGSQSEPSYDFESAFKAMASYL